MKPITTVLMIALLATVASAQTVSWSLEPAEVDTIGGNVSVPDGYTAYTLMLDAEDGYYIDGLDLFAGGGGIYGDFFQLWNVVEDELLGTTTITKTPLAGQFAERIGSIDSHLLLGGGDVFSIDPEGYAYETNPVEVAELTEQAVISTYMRADGTAYHGVFALELDDPDDPAEDPKLIGTTYLQSLPLAHLLVKDDTTVTVVGSATVFDTPNPGLSEAPTQVEIVPEPMTMSLLGLGGLAVLRRRRK